MEKFAAGIDAGSTVIKFLIIDSKGNVVKQIKEETEPLLEQQVESILRRVKAEGFDIEKIPMVATGYGSNLVKNTDKRITEITCHAKGAFFLFREEALLIDIGGQDSKVVSISSDGTVEDFVMNDKCAAGTGRFLETSAWRLKIPIEEFGKIALSTDEEATISSTCAVFAESEVISRIARGEKPEAIIRGLHRSLVKRIVALASTVGFKERLILTGGVALNPAIVAMIEEETGIKPLLPKNPQMVGALGAAVVAGHLL